MTQAPETPPEIPPVTPTGGVPARQRLVAAVRDSRAAIVRAGRTLHAFMNELGGDHSFWLHMMAVRSGAAMTLLTLAGGVAVALTLPFALAAMMITGLAFVAGLATVGIIAGSRFAWARVRHAYDVIRHRDNPHAPARAPVAMPTLADNALVKRVAAWPLSRKLVATRTWQVTDRFMRRQKKWMLGGTALSGAAVTAGMGTWVLLAKVTILPVVAVGSAVSLVALWAVAGVISGTASLYFGTRALVQWHRASKQKRLARTVVDQPVTADAVPSLTHLSSLRPFTIAQEKHHTAQNDNAAAAPPTQATPPSSPKRT